jgi:hypothetical protein
MGRACSMLREMKVLARKPEGKREPGRPRHRIILKWILKT